MLHVIPALKDNYIWLLETTERNVVIVDPGQSQPVIDYIKHKQLNPIAILLTHHHQDHIAGTTKLQKQYPDIHVFGSKEINLPITDISNQDTLTIDNITFNVIQVPGHTLAHMAYYAKPYLFSGDTLFSAGCGRIFEGTFQQMFNSLNRLKALPDETIICPAHEYTASNLKFARYLVPQEDVISNYYQQIKAQKITLPTTMAKERKINLFLRCDDDNLQSQFNIKNELELFIFFRTQKDIF